MKKFLSGLGASAAIALSLGFSPHLIAATQASGNSLAWPRMLSRPQSATQVQPRPSFAARKHTLSGNWKQGQPGNLIAPRVSSGPLNGKTPIASGKTLRPMDLAGSSSLAVNFPGFQQAGAVFSAMPSVSSAESYIALSADVNHDGLPDLINLQSDGTLNVLLNPGAGKLGSMQITNTNRSISTLGGSVDYAVATDLDGDGYPDLVVTSLSSSSAIILHNQKDGTFASAVKQPLAFASGNSLSSTNGGGVVVGDVNGDGIPDLVALLLTANTTNGAFSSSVELVTYSGKGDGTFAKPLAEQQSTIAGYQVVNTIGQTILADMNKDGHLDIVFMAAGEDASYNAEAFITVLSGSGAGTFSNFPTTLPKTGAIVPQVYGFFGIGGLSAQDIDGDGNPDVIFADTFDPNIFLATGNGDGTLNTPKPVVTGLGSTFSPYQFPQLVNVADATGDGVPDIEAYYDGSISVYSGDGKGNFTLAAQLASGSGSESQTPETVVPLPADFNGDGQLDLARIDFSTNIGAIYYGANGSFAGAQALALKGGSPSNIHAIASGDFNGDGISDVLAYDYSIAPPGPYAIPNLVVGINDGKGNFTWSQVMDGETMYYASVAEIEPLAVDFNGDNRADIVFTSFSYNPASNGGIWIMLNKGDGTFAPPAQITLSKPPGCWPALADAGDINGDGKLDMVFAYWGDSTMCGSSGSTPAGIYSLLGNGDGTFTSNFLAVKGILYEPKLIDFNGDGKLDVAVNAVDTFFGSGFDFMILPGNGDGTFNAATAVHPFEGNYNYVVASIIPGDFDSDGKQDLTLGVDYIEQNGEPLLATSGVITLKGHGDFTFDAPTEYLLGSYPTDGKYADINGDGHPELLMSLTYGDYNFEGNVPHVSSFGYFVNLGDGSFSALQQTITPPSDFSDDQFEGAYGLSEFSNDNFLITGDFNNDGAVDVLNSQYTFWDAYISSSALFLNNGAVKFSLTASSATVDQGAPVTLTATLAPTVSTQSPTGTISLYNNGTLLETVPVAGTTTTLSLSSLPVGSDAITATYSGDSNFNGAKAGAAVTVAITALAPDFTVSAAPGSLTLTQGATGVVTVSLAANTTFNGAITLACTGAPAEATCTVNPGSVTLAAGQTGTASIIVASTGKGSKYQASNDTLWMKTAGGISIAGMLLWSLPRRRKLPAIFNAALLILFSLGALAAVTGCGSSGNAGTPVGNATLTITATAGSVSHTQTITLQVTKP